MVAGDRKISVVGRFGIWPMLRLSLPARRLLAYLALRNGEVSRKRAAAELWPETSEDVCRANLRRALWQVPREWADAIGDMLVLAVESDLPEARRAAARAIEGQRLTFDQIDILSQDVLPDWHEDWAIEAYEEFRLIRVQALEAACRTFTAHGNHALAVQAGAAACVAEPLRESATQALIEAHLAQHNRFAAIECYRALSRRLHDELGVAPHKDLTERIAKLGPNPLVA
jgi:DNA-binding SARP family transcriptional activator